RRADDRRPGAGRVAHRAALRAAAVAAAAAAAAAAGGGGGGGGAGPARPAPVGGRACGGQPPPPPPRQTAARARPPPRSPPRTHLDQIDGVEVIADDWFGIGRQGLRALRTLGAQVPVVLHGVSLGLASSTPVDLRRLDAMARVTELALPELWSEHLAFVRGGGCEIGHLAAPPRNAATIGRT